MTEAPPKKCDWLYDGLTARQLWRVQAVSGGAFVAWAMSSELGKRAIGDGSYRLRVLDLGIERGLSGAMARTRWPRAHIVGVELHAPTLAHACESVPYVYDEPIRADVIAWAQAERHSGRPPYDLIIGAELIEHLPRDHGELLFGGLVPELLAPGGACVMTTPIGYTQQDEMDGNPHERHECGWEPEEVHRVLHYTPIAISPKTLYDCGVYLYVQRQRARAPRNGGFIVVP